MSTKRTLLTIGVLLGLWKGLALLIQQPYLPPPETVLEAILKEGLWRHFLRSSFRVVVSLGVALQGAVPLGLLMGRRPEVDRVLRPAIYFLYPVPKIVFLPVVLLLFGLGDLSKVAIISLIVSFPILVASRDASRWVDPEWIVALRSLGAGGWDIFRHVVLPATLPHILTALKIGIGTSIAVLFFVESYATEEGLGWAILDAWGRLDYPGMYGAMAAMAGLGVGLYLIVEMADKRARRWMGPE